MKKIWVNKADSFRDAERFDRNYYFTMSASKRLETMQLLREMYYKIKKRPHDESRKGLRRVIRLFNKNNKVRYCIVGAYAVAFYARPKYTKIGK